MHRVEDLRLEPWVIIVPLWLVIDRARPHDRLFHCPCQPQPTRTFSPLVDLLPERTAPEHLYLEAKFASLMSYGLTVKLLEEILPLGGTLNTTIIRNHLQTVT